MSQSIHRRGAALLMTAGLAALALACEPAQAADLISQNTFSLFQSGGGRIGLDGETIGVTYGRNWNRTSQDFGTGITCVGFKCSGSSLTLNTTGSTSIEIQMTAQVNAAIMDFTQGTTTQLSGAGKQYDFTTTQSYIKDPKFSTTNPVVTVSATASLTATDTLFAEGCSGSCAIDQNSTLFKLQTNDLPVFVADPTNNRLYVDGQLAPTRGLPYYDSSLGSYEFGRTRGLDTSIDGYSRTQNQASASLTQEAAGETAKVLTMAAQGVPTSGSTGDIKLKGVDLGSVVYNAGSVSLNVVENLVQSAKMTVTHAVKTFFENSKSQAIAVPVHLAGTADGTYVSESEVDGALGFTLGDGVTSLAGDQVITATTYDVAFDYSLAMNLTGDIIVDMLRGQVNGQGFGVFYDDNKLQNQTFTIYDHVYHEYFTTYNILTIPDLSGGVPEPASWALMLLGFGGMGLMLRRRARSRLTA